jgi:peptidoglycan/xylan/chitin deacetylase (PgdA/CDA1 family)
MKNSDGYNSIPTVMFHSVGNNINSWQKQWLSVSLEHFERFCEYLRRKKFESLFLDEWYDLQYKAKLTNKNQIVLTFDDGYIDNWVFAYPILKKYGIKATLFINPEFVDPSDRPRPTLEDVWNNKLAIDELKTLGYLNWEELQVMDATDTIDVQCHSMSHNFYFKSDTLIDHYEGQDEYHWLAWLERPDRKPYWIVEDQREIVPYGYPVFEFDRSLGIRRFMPTDRFVSSFLLEYKKLKQERAVDIKERLVKFAGKYKAEYGSLGRYESDSERYDRYRYEIFESKRVLEKKLNKKVEYLCWPGGGYNDKSVQTSIDAGYKASTLMSRDKKRIGLNKGGYKRIKRFGLGSFFKYNGCFRYVKNTNHLVHSYLGKTGNSFYKSLMRFTKYYYQFQNNPFGKQ